MNVEIVKQNVVDAFDLSDALDKIDRASKSGKLNTIFEQGDEYMKPHAIDYVNGLLCLGFDVMPSGLFKIYISWEKRSK